MITNNFDVQVGAILARNVLVSKGHHYLWTVRVHIQLEQSTAKLESGMWQIVLDLFFLSLTF